MQLILHYFGLLNEHVHHNVYLLTDLVSLLFEHLQQVIASYQLILQIIPSVKIGFLKENSHHKLILTSRPLICLLTDDDTSSMRPALDIID